MTRQHALLDSAVKRGRLLGVTVDQLTDEIEQSQADQFGERLSVRAPSPAAPAFWRAVLLSLPHDARHVSSLFARGAGQVQAEWRGGPPWQAAAGLLIALARLFPGRMAAQGFGQLWLHDGARGHRVRRSAYAVWRSLVGTLAPLLAGVALVEGLRWSGLLPASWNGLLDALVTAATVAGMISAIGGALLMRR